MWVLRMWEYDKTGYHTLNRYEYPDEYEDVFMNECLMREISWVIMAGYNFSVHRNNKVFDLVEYHER